MPKKNWSCLRARYLDTSQVMFVGRPFHDPKIRGGRDGTTRFASSVQWYKRACSAINQSDAYLCGELKYPSRFLRFLTRFRAGPAFLENLDDNANRGVG